MKTKKTFWLAFMFMLGAGLVSAQNRSLKLENRNGRQDRRYMSSALAVEKDRAGKPQWVLSETRPIKSADSAKITLRVEMPWPDGEGYQLLLDADATAFGDIIPAKDGYFATGDIDAEVYDQFEFKIPQNATGGIFDETFVPFRGEASIMIPEGDYDYVIINPEYEREMWWIAEGGAGVSRADNRHFYAGVEYVFIVAMHDYGDYGGDSCILTPRSGLDLAVDDIVSPVSSVNFTSNETVTVNILNVGEIPSTDFELTYTLGDRPSVTEHVEKVIKPGESFVYTFAKTADLTEGEAFELKVVLTAEGDPYVDNNMLRTTVRKITPVQPPYICTFGSASDMDQWTVLDRNKDGVTFYWKENYYRHEENVTIEGMDASEIYGHDDYLITARPIALGAGAAYLNFEYKSISYSARPDRLEVLYGQSGNPLQMERLLLLDSLDDTMLNENWDMLFKNQPIEISEAGNYFFAFHAFSGPKSVAMFIDNVEINEGQYIGKPDLDIVAVELPLSSCNTSLSASMRVEVGNKGQTDITGFEIKWQIDDQAEQSQTFESVVAYGGSLWVDIEAPLAFAGEGAHNVRVTGVVKTTVSGAEETVLDNNVRNERVMLYAPSPLPFATDFSNEEQRLDWTSRGEWTWDNGYNAYVADAKGHELISKCIDFEAGKSYRLSMDFALGLVYGGMPIDADLVVKIGKTGTATEDWTTIWKGKWYQSFSKGDATFSVPEAGEYSVSISSSNGFLFVRMLDIKEVTGADVRLNGLAEVLPTVLPLGQVKESLFATVAVENRGVEPVEAKVAVFSGAEELGSASVKLDKIGDIKDVMVKFVCPKVEAGRGLNLVFRATIENASTPDPSQDNEFQYSIRISHDEMGYDFITDDMFAGSANVVSAETEMMLGVPFTLYQNQVLTQIALGMKDPQNQYITLSVHEFDVAKQQLGAKLVNQIVRSGSENGFISFDVTPVLLESGKTYLISETSAGAFMVVDRSASGSFYMSNGKEVVEEASFGNLGIRAVFKRETPNEVALEADCALQLFPNPATEEIVIRSGEADLQQIEIFRLTGVSVFRTTLSNQREFRFRVANLEQGLYFACVKTSAGTRILKFVVK